MVGVDGRGGYTINEITFASTIRSQVTCDLNANRRDRGVEIARKRRRVGQKAAIPGYP
jgi:hypothetical protein